MGSQGGKVGSQEAKLGTSAQNTEPSLELGLQVAGGKKRDSLKGVTLQGGVQSDFTEIFGTCVEYKPEKRG